MANLLFNLIFFLVTLNYVHSSIEVLTHEESKLVEEIDSFELNIGKQIPDSGIQGNVVVSEPEDACKEIQSPPPPNDETSPIKLWFVLVDNSGACFSDVKFKNIKDAGYDGAILYNTKPNGRKYLKENSDANVDLSILFVSPTDGKKIKSSYTFDKGVYVRINRRPEEQFVLIDNPRLMLFIGAIIGVLALVFFGSAYFYRKLKGQPEEKK